MEKRLRGPATSLTSEGERRSRLLPRVLLGLGALLVAGGAAGVLATVWLPPPDLPERRAVRPSAAPAAAGAAGALSAVTAGVPAAPRALAQLIADRERLVRERPADAGAWAVLGAAYVERSRRTADPADLPKADSALRTSLRLRPQHNADALTGLAALADERRDFGAAREWAEAALKLEPKRWAAYPPLLDAYGGLGDQQAARRALDELLKLHHSPAAAARAAAVYWDRGWREDAAAQLTDAAQRATEPAERAAYLAQYGRIAWERGDFAEALRYDEAALRLDGGQREALAGRARTLASLGRTTEARAAYGTALAGRPDPELLLELGELYEAAGDEERAAAQYELVRARVRQQAAAGVDGELVLGRLEADHGDAAEAVERLREEWRRQPGIAVADALGWALHRDGRDEEALTFATTATDSAKGGGVRKALYAYHRGAIELALDRPGVARRHLELALRTNPAFSPLWAPAAQEALSDLGDPPLTEAPADVRLQAAPVPPPTGPPPPAAAPPAPPQAGTPAPAAGGEGAGQGSGAGTGVGR
ncbi:tetratricopeptide repeat protein [Streptomyces sp. PD-S100-1]|uniref:tetratricopeptide repeat protein n=1 Tax=Streptomyces sp. PD-S100-1 TaxID=3394351 RepID=UPI0039BC5FC8